LLSAGDGFVIEFARDGQNWKEERRWNSLGSFGTADSPGDDLTHVNTPTTLAACGDRAVVYDSGNQRLVKLRLEKR
jgi:hypothetical protein